MSKPLIDPNELAEAEPKELFAAMSAIRDEISRRRVAAQKILNDLAEKPVPR